MTKKTEGVTDLAQFDEAVKRQNDGIAVPIKSMDGKTDLGFSIRVAGPDSEIATAAQEAMADELIEQENLTRVQAREAADRGLRYLAKITLGWEPKVVMDGQELAFSEENALKLYRRFKFIKEQVDRAAGQRSRFLRG